MKKLANGNTSFEDVEDMIDFLDRRRTPLQEAWWWIRHGIKHEMSSVYYRAGDWFYRAFRGYADQDWYEYNYNTSRRAVKLLTLLRDRGHGNKIPEGLSCIQGIGGDRSEWCRILNDIIFFHTVAAHLPRPIDKQFVKTYTTKRGTRSYTITDYDSLELTEEEKVQYTIGKWRYLQAYEKLWD